MRSLKRRFLKKFSSNFSELLIKDVKLMQDKVLEVSRRYLLSFLGYRENAEWGGGKYLTPTPSAAWVKIRCFLQLSIL